jgi:membrane-associated protease RseP (regulator of RpoE activity)
MKYLSRPYRSFGIAALACMGAALVMAPPGTRAQATELTQILQEPSPLLLHSGQGYLGVLVGDVDTESAAKLKLKEVRGAVITLIDHDAPAGQKGLKVNDVVLQINGQTVEGAEQFSRMMREIPAGRTVSLEISRDGNIQTMAIELVDHKMMENDVWNKIGNSNSGSGSAPGMGIFSGMGDLGLGGGFHGWVFGSSLNVGALVEPLTSQMADYLGVPSGLMVKQVARKSAAAAAGLKAFDVILKVGTDAITTSADWERSLHANAGKPVQVTILRDRKQQTLTLEVDSKHHQTELELEDIYPGANEEMAEANQVLAWDAAAAAEALRDQLGGLRNFGVTQEQAEELRRQAEALGKGIKPEDFKVDPKQLDELKKQMEQFRHDFNGQDFKVDPRAMEQFKQQMEQFRQDFKDQHFKVDPKQMDELKRQLQELQILPCPDFD